MYKMNYDLMQELNDKQRETVYKYSIIGWWLLFRDQQPETQPYYDSGRCTWAWLNYRNTGQIAIRFEDKETEIVLYQWGKTSKEAYQKVNAHVRKLYRLNIK